MGNQMPNELTDVGQYIENVVLSKSFGWENVWAIYRAQQVCDRQSLKK